MKRTKKWLAGLLAVVMCLGVSPASMPVTKVEAAQSVDSSVIDENSYGAQLTEVQKKVYLALVENYIEGNGLPNGVASEMTFTPDQEVEYTTDTEVKAAGQDWLNDIKYAYYAFVDDYPQMFWTNGVKTGYSYKIITHSDNTKTYKLTSATMTLSEGFSVTSEEIADYNKGIQDAVEAIAASVKADASAFDYYKAIHDWICEKASYNYDAAATPSSAPKAFSSYPVFAGDGAVVCEGYGESYKILCDQITLQKGIDLECVLVTGKGVTQSGAEDHLWNQVLMPDGNWYGVDATWDDQETVMYDYFLCGKKSLCFYDRTFEEEHLEEQEIVSGIVFTYPETAEYGYNGYLGENLEWSYSDGKLIITGNGELPDYPAEDRMPWREYREEITSVEIGSGITKIPEGFLAGCDSIEALTIPFVGSSAQSNNTSDAVLGHIFGKVTGGTAQYYEYDSSTGGLRGTTYQIPSTLKLVRITNDTEIPVGAFSNCTNLTNVYFDSAIEKIEACAFFNCTGLEAVHFAGGAPEIQGNSFSGCGNITGYIPEGNTSWTADKMQKYGASNIDWRVKQVVTVNNMSITAPVTGKSPESLSGVEGQYTVVTQWTTLDGQIFSGQFAERTVYQMTAVYTAADAYWFTEATKPVKMTVKLPDDDTAIVKLGDSKVVVSDDEKTMTVTHTFATDSNFRGGSLRKSTADGKEYADAEKTSIRFGYYLYDLEGLTLTSWEWNWGTNIDNLTKNVKGENRLIAVGKANAWTSNLVVQNVPVKNYKTTIYSNLVMTYTNETTGEQVVIDTGVIARTVYNVASEAADAPIETGDDEYGQKILDAYDENQWTGYY